MSSCLLKPPAAPCTALFKRARKRPCFERSGPDSPVREMVTTLPWTSIGKPAKSGCATLPRGPWATNTPSLTSTEVPAGTWIGILPIRDIAVLLPDLAEELAADPALARLDVGQQALRRRDDPQAEAVAHRLDLVGPLVDPAPRLADALEVADHRHPLGAVAQEDAQGRRGGPLDHPEILDEPLLLEELADLELELGGGHVQPVVLGQVGVPDPAQQIRDGVGHTHAFSPKGSRGRVSVRLTSSP